MPVTPAIAGVLRGRAAKLYAQAQPVAAACCALAMSDTQVAVRYLLRYAVEKPSALGRADTH